MNNKKNFDNDATDIDLKLDKKQSGFWKKVSGLWEVKKKSDAPPRLPSEMSEAEKTSRTISSNHTFQGQLKGADLAGKGHNFDTTEVEMGKLSLHQVPQNKNKELPKSFSNVDSATLTGIKLDMKKGSFLDELTRTKLNVFSAFKKMRNKTDDHEIESPVKGSTKTQIQNSDGTVHLALPKSNQWKDVSKILVAGLLLGAILLGILYGLGQWSTVKEKVMNIAGQTPSQDKIENASTSPIDQKAVSQTVNYQATGRGLIYNCKGKHWACVDKTNYIICRGLSKQGSKDCYARGVLKTNEACFATQKKFATTNAKTDFCN
jgi:hypothetical protein